MIVATTVVVVVVVVSTIVGVLRGTRGSGLS